MASCEKLNTTTAVKDMTPNYTGTLHGIIICNPLAQNGVVPTQAIRNESTSERTQGETIAIGIVLGTIIFLTLVGNSLVVIAVISFRRLRSVTNYFVVSLAVADITVAVLVMPYSLIYEVVGTWQFGWIFCFFWTSCDVTCCTSSILHLCVISLDRYWAITKPLHYGTQVKAKKAYLAIASIWLCSIAISFVPIYLGWFADETIEHDLYQDTPYCGLYVNRTYAVISSLTSFYIPIGVMLFAYFKIFRVARRQVREIKRLESVCRANDFSVDPSQAKRAKRLSKDTKAIKTLGIIMGCFTLSWLPFFLMYVILPFCESCDLPPSAVSAITWLGYANCFINPCVYALLNRDFRMAFKSIIICKRCKRKFKDRSLRRQCRKHRTILLSTRPIPKGLYGYITDSRATATPRGSQSSAAGVTVRINGTQAHLNHKKESCFYSNTSSSDNRDVV